MEISDVPTEIAIMILEKISYVDRLPVRLVSRQFRTIVDATLPEFKIITITFRRADVVVKMDERKFVRTNVDELMRGMHVIISNPKLRLETFEIGSDWTSLGVLEDETNNFWTFNFEAKCKELKLRDLRGSQDNNHRILSNFNPRIIKGLEIFSSQMSKNTMLEICKTHHWNNIEDLTVGSFFKKIPTEQLFHIKKLTMISKEKWTQEDLLKIRTLICHSTNLQHVFIDAKQSDDVNPKYLLQGIAKSCGFKLRCCYNIIKIQKRN